jgi:uncharacterized protein YdbL (DUF1318 family)
MTTDKVVEETKAGKYVKPAGEGWRKEGNNPAW